MKSLFTILFFYPLIVCCQNSRVEEYKIENVEWSVSFEPESYSFNYQNKKRFTLNKQTVGLEGLPEGELIKVITLSNDTIQNYVLPIHKFTFNYGDFETSIIKFRKIEVGRVHPFETLIFQYINKNGTKKWVNVELKALNDINSAILMIKPEFFNQFQTLDGKSGIEPIDKANRACVDFDKSTINISKLGAYLKTKPKELEPYCDFE